MFNQGFHLLSRNDLDVQLSTLFRHWDANPTERAEFVGWAWVVASAADFSATENRAHAAALLRDECSALHRTLSDGLHERSTMSLEMVSTRMFLDWLAHKLGDLRIAA